jgi:hypothetical protein
MLRAPEPEDNRYVRRLTALVLAALVQPACMGETMLTPVAPSITALNSSVPGGPAVVATSWSATCASQSPVEPSNAPPSRPETCRSRHYVAHVRCDRPCMIRVSAANGTLEARDHLDVESTRAKASDETLYFQIEPLDPEVDVEVTLRSGNETSGSQFHFKRAN